MNTEPLQPVTQAHIDAYRRDGVALLEGMIDSDWVALLLAEWNRISKSIKDPSDLYRLPPVSLGLAGRRLHDIASKKTTRFQRCGCRSCPSARASAAWR